MNNKINISPEKYQASSSKWLYFVDSLLILLNLSLSGTIIPSLLFSSELGYNIGIVIILNMAYLFFRFHINIKIPTHSLFIIYFLLNFINVFTSLLTSTGRFFPSLYLMLNTTFYVILYNLYIRYRKEVSLGATIKLIIRGYIWLGIVSIVSILLLFLLVRIGFDININDISHSMSVFKANVETLGHTYYFPYSLGIFLELSYSVISIPFLADYGGRICGLAYEPHISTFLVFPSLFFLLAYARSYQTKLFLFLIWLFIALISLSVTNIIAFCACITALLFLDKKWRYLGLIPLIIGVYFFVDFLLDSPLSFVLDKISGNDTSSIQRTI